MAEIRFQTNQQIDQLMGHFDGALRGSGVELTPLAGTLFQLALQAQVDSSEPHTDRFGQRFLERLARIQIAQVLEPNSFGPRRMGFNEAFHFADAVATLAKFPWTPSKPWPPR